MVYLDFELAVGQGQGLEYPVRVLNSPAGEIQALMRFPFDKIELQNHLLRLECALLQSGGQYRSGLTKEEQTVQEFGKALFEHLIAGDIRSLYDVSRASARRDGKGLRLKLRFDDPVLAALPWEFLYDARQKEYLCLRRETPIVRYLELSEPVHSLTLTPPLRILGMVASPNRLQQLDIAAEQQRVDQALMNLQGEGLVELTWLKGQTWRDLHRALQRDQWHVFHFIGHGGFESSREGYIALTDDRGLPEPLWAKDLKRLLDSQAALRLVILNACDGAKGDDQDIFSSTAATLVRHGIPATLAMQYKITDRAAIEISRAFYEAITYGLPVDAAVVEARKAASVGIENSMEWGTPVLYMRTPDGILFDIQNSSTLGHKPGDIQRGIEDDPSTFTRKGHAFENLGDDQRAVRWFQMAANRGEAEGQLYMGIMYQEGRGGLPQSDSDAVDWYRRAAGQGNAIAQTNLGWLYERGRGGLHPSDTDAVEWYRKASDSGQAIAKVNLGLMFERGAGGLPRSDDNAGRLYSEAANQNDSEGQFRLALMYELGSGNFSQSDSEAVRWCSMAAESGHLHAQYELGHMYRMGRCGLSPSNSEAYKWFRLAAEQGDVDAQFELGAMFERGWEHQPPSYIDAVQWYRKATSQGHRRAQEALDQIQRK